ncbi:MAG: F0F1 ATP synthase subunit epsilon [Candidatus Desulforudis sp.]|nr:F0F1 ATP synthase subunit epsilon [Desulforudis sp.]
MSEKTQKVAIVTPEQVVYGEEARFVQARGTEGELGILPMHTPLITSLAPGLLRIQKEGKWTTFVVAGGFMEVRDNRVVVLANAAERPEEIDVERAKRAKERAEKRLAAKDPEIDVVRAKVALQRAMVRIDAAGLKH